jgi:putative transposase
METVSGFYVIFVVALMEIIKTYRYKLKLTKPQQKRIDNWIGTCRYIYNVALETKIGAYKAIGKSPSCYDLQKQITDVRKEFDWVEDVPVQSLQDTMERLDKAYKTFFKGGGFPRWAKKDKYRSITFKQVKHRDGKFVLPKIGAVKYFDSREIKGELRRATITKEFDGYYISVMTKQERETIPIHESQVGVDLGVAFFASLSDGTQIDNPRFTKKYERQLRIEHRSLSRKQKGSKSWYKQKRVVAKTHAKITRCRKDFLHKAATSLVNKHGLIAIEDLKVKNMVRFGHLSKSISDVSWSSFREMLEYKGDWYNVEIVAVDPKYTSQTCSDCGAVDKKSRISQSKYVCTSCGCESNADINAAKEILKRGRAMSRSRERSRVPQALAQKSLSI